MEKRYVEGNENTYTSRSLNEVRDVWEEINRSQVAWADTLGAVMYKGNEI